MTDKQPPVTRLRNWTLLSDLMHAWGTHMHTHKKKFLNHALTRDGVVIRISPWNGVYVTQFGVQFKTLIALASSPDPSGKMLEVSPN